MASVRTCKEEWTAIGPRNGRDVWETWDFVLKSKYSSPVPPQHNGAPAVKGDKFVTVRGSAGDMDLQRKTIGRCRIKFTRNTFSQMCRLVHTAQKQQSWTYHCLPRQLGLWGWSWTGSNGPPLSLPSLSLLSVSLCFPPGTVEPATLCQWSFVCPPPSSRTQEWQRAESPYQICSAYCWVIGFFFPTWSVRNRRGWGGEKKGGEGLRFTF